MTKRPSALKSCKRVLASRPVSVIWSWAGTGNTCSPFVVSTSKPVVVLKGSTTWQVYAQQVSWVCSFQYHDERQTSKGPGGSKRWVWIGSVAWTPSGKVQITPMVGVSKLAKKMTALFCTW